MFRGIRIQAVALGVVTDLGATLASGIALMIVLRMGAGMENVPEEEARQFIENAFQEPSYLLTGGVLGLLATILGGYVAARAADVAPLLNAACVGLFSVILGLLFIGESPFWLGLIGILLTLPAAIAGGLLWRRSSSRG